MTFYLSRLHWMGWSIFSINQNALKGNRTRKKIKWNEIRAVMIGANQLFKTFHKNDLVVPWQCLDIGKEVDKVHCTENEVFH